MTLANMLDFNIRISASLLRTLSNAIPQRFGKSRVVKDANLPYRHKTRHPSSVAHAKQGARDDYDPVKT
jgi:hypothetical protein